MTNNQLIVTKKLTLTYVLIEDIYTKSLNYFKTKEYHKGWRGYWYTLKITRQDTPNYINVEYTESGNPNFWWISPLKDTDSNVEIELRQIGVDVEVEVNMYKKNPYQVYEFGYIDPVIFWVDFIRDYWEALGVDPADYQEYLYPRDLHEKRLNWERDHVRNVKIAVYTLISLTILVFLYLLIRGK